MLCKCMYKFMTTVLSQARRAMSWNVVCLSGKLDRFCFYCISLSFVSTHSHGSNQMDKACFWQGQHLAFHAFIF